jgi:hypothetical protein
VKRPVAATIALAIFMLVLLSQAGALTAQVTPLPTATAVSVSPLATPLPHWEPSYNPHPKKINPRAVPFVNEAGETIVKQYIIERPYQDPIVLNFKAQLPAAPKAGPLTFQSPLENPGPYQIYMPIVYKPANAQVLVIAYIGYTPTTTPTVLAQNLIANLARGTSFHGTGESSIGFEMVGGHVEISNTRAPHRSDNSWDMGAIYQQHNICNRIPTEGIDEVWVYIDGNTDDPNYVYGSEWDANGPLWTSGDGSNKYPPNCGKQMFTMGFNFNRGDADAMEAWVHSAEVTFMYPELSSTQSCDFGHPGNYGAWGSDWNSGCSALGYSDTSGFKVLPDYAGHVGVCGDAHFPPNTPREHAYALPNPYAYIYNSPDTYQSRCTDWQWNTLTNTVPVSGGTWGNTEVGYLTWWMQNIPGLGNNLHGRTGALRPNWWDFRLHR